MAINYKLATRSEPAGADGVGGNVSNTSKVRRRDVRHAITRGS